MYNMEKDKKKFFTKGICGWLYHLTLSKRFRIETEFFLLQELLAICLGAPF